MIKMIQRMLKAVTSFRRRFQNGFLTHEGALNLRR
jgi:hypothetical protein